MSQDCGATIKLKVIVNYLNVYISMVLLFLHKFIIHCSWQTSEAVIESKPYAPTAIPCPTSPDIPIELSILEIEK